MENKELIAKIAAQKEAGGAEQAEREELVKFLIIQIEDTRYAFYAEQIKEIVMDYPLYYVPFVPKYIRGFINRHGEPYTVFDLRMLLDGELLEATTFLISNVGGDQIAFLVSDVVEILKVPNTQVRLLTSTEDRDTFFLGAVSARDTELFILNLENVVGRLAYDLEAS